jgi:hypothetical protein
MVWINKKFVATLSGASSAGRGRWTERGELAPLVMVRPRAKRAKRRMFCGVDGRAVMRYRRISDW